MTEQLVQKEKKLVELLCRMGRMIVAYSGGVDSLLLAKAAVESVGDNVRAVIADSPSLPAKELSLALKLASELNIPCRVVKTDEFSDSRYLANPPNRCYFCKTALFKSLSQIAKEEQFPWICYGANIDDKEDWRPGMQAAEEFGVRAPLLEAGLGKEEIRAMVRSRGISVWDKPALPCTASRIPYGHPVTIEALHRIERSEAWLRDRGFKEVRVRDHYPIARIEVPADSMAALVPEQLRKELVDTLRQFGYRYITLDLLEFYSGSLNNIIK